MVINTVRNKYNKDKNYNSIDIENVSEADLQTDEYIYEPDENESDDDYLRRIDCVEKSFDQLDDIFKEVILLRYKEEFEYEKIAELLNIPEGTVKSRINRGREHMKNIFVKLYIEQI
ncbi:MAG: RNA polymerase sigma factor [Ignavibacteria bacterium]|nr:RNA polymerase sigma factor [Ignavibacteria bacterium]